MKKSTIEIQWIAADIDEAKQIAKLLVEHKLIACANLIPNITSIYIWDNQLEETQEVLCLFKAKAEKYTEIEKLITVHCSYDVPAILKIEVDGYHPYLDWVLTLP